MAEEKTEEKAEDYEPGNSSSESDNEENKPPKPAQQDEELEAAIAAIRATKDLPRPPYPTLPNLNAPGSMQNKVLAVQTYIEKLQYNFTGVNYFDIRKNRPMTRILETAREITRQALPIKCVEAVFLGCYLTQGLRDLERVPISFKSQVDGNTYKHIVLAVKHNSKWGAIGLSRRRELYYKELTFESLGELFLEFKRSYERVFHTLKRVRVGLPMSHDTLAGEPVCWSYLTAKCSDSAAAAQLLADHGRTAHRLHEQWRVEVKKAGANGQKPPAPPKKQKPGEGEGNGNGNGKAAAAAGKKGAGAAASASATDDAAAKKGGGVGSSSILAGSESDSSDGGAAAPSAAPPSAVPSASGAKDLGDAADAPPAAAASGAGGAARPSFLSV